MALAIWTYWKPLRFPRDHLRLQLCRHRICVILPLTININTKLTQFKNCNDWLQTTILKIRHRQTAQNKIVTTNERATWQFAIKSREIAVKKTCIYFIDLLILCENLMKIY